MGSKQREVTQNHTQHSLAAPASSRPFLLLGGCNFKILFRLLSLLAPSLLPVLPTHSPPPQTASPGSAQPEQRVVEIVSLFNFRPSPVSSLARCKELASQSAAGTIKAWAASELYLHSVVSSSNSEVPCYRSRSPGSTRPSIFHRGDGGGGRRAPSQRRGFCCQPRDNPSPPRPPGHKKIRFTSNASQAPSSRPSLTPVSSAQQEDASPSRGVCSGAGLGMRGGFIFFFSLLSCRVGFFPLAAWEAGAVLDASRAHERQRCLSRVAPSCSSRCSARH